MFDERIHHAVASLQGRYADIVTRRALNEMRDIVASDATFSFDVRDGSPVEVSGVDELIAFGGHSLGQFSFYVYQPLNAVVIEADETMASGRSYALEVGVHEATGSWMEFYGWYRDSYRRDEGEWRFAGRRFQSLARRINGATTTWPADPS